MNVSERFKHVRESEGLTQEKFAEALNISRSSVSQIESGRSKPTIEMITNIISLFKVDANYFFREDIPNLIPNVIPNEVDLVKNVPFEKELNNLKRGDINDRLGLFSECINSAMKINKVVEAILKVLDLSKHTGQRVFITKKEAEVLNDLSDNYLDQLIELSMNERVRNDKNSQEFMDLSNELAIKEGMANRLLNKYIDKVHRSAFKLKNHEIVVLNPEDFKKR